MRYQVGQELFVVHFSFADVTNPVINALYNSPNSFNVEDVVKEVNIIKLVVETHHRVRNEFDAADVEPSCNGFTLKDVANPEVKYLNQYPRASYGQMSNEADYRFSLDRTNDPKDWGQLEADIISGKVKVAEAKLLDRLLADLMDAIEAGDEIIQGIKDGTKDKNLFIDLELLEKFAVRRRAVLEQIHTTFREKYPDTDYKLEKRSLIEGSSIKHWEVDFFQV